MEWFSVKDRLPEKGDRVLAYLRGNEMAVAVYNGETFVDIINESLRWWVTHWMPLPEPPK